MATAFEINKQADFRIKGSVEGSVGSSPDSCSHVLHWVVSAAHQPPRLELLPCLSVSVSTLLFPTLRGQ